MINIHQLAFICRFLRSMSQQTLVYENYPTLSHTRCGQVLFISTWHCNNNTLRPPPPPGPPPKHWTTRPLDVKIRNNNIFACFHVSGSDVTDVKINKSIILTEAVSCPVSTSEKGVPSRIAMFDKHCIAKKRQRK